MNSRPGCSRRGAGAGRVGAARGWPKGAIMRRRCRPRLSAALLSGAVSLLTRVPQLDALRSTRGCVLCRQQRDPARPRARRHTTAQGCPPAALVGVPGGRAGGAWFSPCRSVSDPRVVLNLRPRAQGAQRCVPCSPTPVLSAALSPKRSPPPVSILTICGGTIVLQLPPHVDNLLVLWASVLYD